MSNGTEIVVGTYEEFLLGYKIEKSGDEMQLIQSFATHAHTSSVRSVASTGRFLASGGADDKIIIHDMKTRTENRVLMHHDGTVNAVAFAGGGTHIISAGADGALTVTQIGNWQIEKHWAKAHKGSPITCIAIHPSSKLALTIGDDHTLRTWNLIKGRQAYAINLASKGAANPLSVVWGPEGQHFSLTGYNDVSVWSISNAAVKHVLKCPSKAVCMVWISETVTAVGLENGEVMIFDIESGQTVNFPAHTQRVKGIMYDDGHIFTVSSSGHIKVWKYKSRKMSLKEKCSLSTGCRITCLTLVKPCSDIKTEPITDEIILESNNMKRKYEDISKETEANMLSEKISKTCMPYVTVSMDDDDDVTEVKIGTPEIRNKPKKRNFKRNKKHHTLKTNIEHTNKITSIKNDRNNKRKK